MTKKWYSKHVKDPFVKKAQREGARSRAAYKLEGIQNKFSLINRGHSVLDLGSAPGAWSALLVKLVGPLGTVVACDLLEMKPISGVRFVQGDFLEQQTVDAICKDGQKFDVIVSDMAPNITGMAVVDQANMLSLIEQAIAMTANHLAVGGALVMKSFSGSGLDESKRLFNSSFSSVKVYKPEASRQASKEIYLIGIGFKV
ncbi:RlmE family RNA methyltransferase [Candidatus Synchoanobacter obligatus]|uniref:Ribosomal RNA large subunit methyltransferase E n=1 Tax=Candidatus Synchoanobacter obligatus TaxID=2919597 RepID=A0ABT1L5Y8_9GAMM|nr:RlmE family RNA methyltransferase [Candidatus Synchoanobacter obligatus]MCP8352298.1 RlmE family RNA methyltransferase [Candidatus Synchoanobacter obligatus]